MSKENLKQLNRVFKIFRPLQLSEWVKKQYRRRAETVERSFADAKQHHGHRYCRYRGLSKVSMQCLLAAACKNMKKMALAKAA